MEEFLAGKRGVSGQGKEEIFELVEKPDTTDIGF